MSDRPLFKNLENLLGFSVSRETFERLIVFEDELLRWSKTHNLIGPKEHSCLWDRHILDSLQCWPLTGGDRYRLDFGTGAGFPGLILACADKEDKDREWVLVEPNLKRATFLRQISSRLELNAEVVPERLGDVSRETLPSVISARAVSELKNLLDMSHHLIRSDTKCVFLKGENVEVELTEAKRYWSFDAETHVSRTDSRAKILVLSEIRKK